MPATITEIKRNPCKPDQKFVCGLVRHRGRSAILAYVSDRPYTVNQVAVPVGSRTVAYYETDLSYVLWRMTGPEGRLLGHYVHLCDGLVVSMQTVEYRDLLLDIWFSPDGTHCLLDEQELSQAVLGGFVGEDTAAEARRNAASIIVDFERIKDLIDARL
ncbi:MAG: DUF402 domain-containing protein [Candidatus Latescibacteria bacterium]|jgi:predicted RNA-binding protein associated with RNAse of E/G family|nr:DUF402 domain-containing protein [Candidatus Latescibacterota bacterium]